MTKALIDLAYLGAAVLFVLGIKGMTHPRTAVRGNLLSAVGMLVAVVATVPQLHPAGWWIVAGGLAVGTVIGVIIAVRVEMTSMPQLVALFNGLGGLASVLIAGAELQIGADALTQRAGLFAAMKATAHGPNLQALIAASAAGLIGAVTFWGSLVAWGKLQELKLFNKPWALPGQQMINGLLALGAVVLAVVVVRDPSAVWAFWALVGLASVLGITLVAPIGGADMPVVVALLNSYSGLAASAAGFVLDNNVLIITGSLVGASGIILTQIMCKAMNRSLVNVLFGRIDASAASASADEVYGGKIKKTSAEEIAMMLEDAQRVVIVPGYGMAVAQAQHATRDLFNLLEGRGTTVEFAIHPVAGRMPGHMNVLLAEVDIPYDKLLEMDTINPTLETVDVAIVLGANDVVNPDARKADSPIAGMPIIDVDKCRTVIVVKRSLSPGFAGIPNPLFALDNSLMYFADGKKAIQDLVAELKQL
jgi:NAD(P) transhydrogenase subunit beta